jgi:hypothetical protein
MALRTPPSWLQQGSHPAENDRLGQQALFSTSGICTTGSLAVTAQASPNMSVQVAAGWAAVVGTITTNMGVYLAYNDAATNLTITAANPTNPRIDRVVLTVSDAYYSGLLNQVAFQVIAGTPAGSPTAPATPSMSISLATISVAAGATSISAGNITDTRTASGSNFAVWTTAQRPSPAAVGMHGFNTTLLSLEYYDGSVWSLVGGSGGGFDPFLLMGA